MQNNPYYKKTINFSFYKHTFEFATTQELFSSTQIDSGSQLLLRTIAEADYKDIHRILDIGCGIGTLGVSLTALYDSPSVLMTDRDALALEFASFNARRNKLQRGVVVSSLGFEGVEKGEKFDLIVSNLPGKASKGVLANILLTSQQYLSDAGRVAIVVVSPLADFIQETLEGYETIEIVLKKANKAYTVFHYQFTQQVPDFQPKSFQDGLYDRSELSDSLLDIRLKTVQGIGEFDNLHFRTQLLAEVLVKNPPKKGMRTLIVNPGQGYLAMLLAQFKPAVLSICSRDLLALKNAARNLEEASYGEPSLLHTASLPSGVIAELLVYALDEHQNLAVVVDDLSRAQFERLLIGGKASQLHRLGLLFKRNNFELRQSSTADSQGQRVSEFRRG